MGITLTPKAEALFQAVDQLMLEGIDINSMTVAQIAGRAGIGKGTTYEYFETKEELIAGALLYKISNMCRKVTDEMELVKCFREKLNLFMDAIDTNEYDKACLLKVLNIVTDNSPISCQINKLGKIHAQDMFMPDNILDYLLECAGHEGWQQGTIPVVYTKLNLASKLLSYAMFSMIPPDQRECDSVVICRLICESICNELGV